ncbi:uncharacterized protein LOC143289195 isoform X2 [Babylonia areolata]|uniref:uncharacterized protein LOC143289195 isoform X2 n=1 Tax=Babylonia areolata TaxID=304850 RepID=UPI003FCFF60E
MSQQPHPFPTHLPRGAVAATALTLSKNSVTTVLRASPAIQIPAAPSVPSVSGSIPGLPTALVRSPVISAIRPATPPTTRTPSPAVSVTDHPRPNLVVQGASGVGGPVPGQPLHITLTPRVSPGAATLAMSEAVKLTPLSLAGKTVQVAHHKLAVGTVGGQPPPPPPASIAAIGVAPHLQQQAVLAAAAASKSGLQVTGAVPAVSLTSLSAALPTTTVMAPASSTIPVAKVTPQRQQLTLTSALPASIAVQTTSGPELTSVADLSSIATQTGAGQLVLSQTPRTQTASVVTATTGGGVLTGAVPTAVTSLAAQHGERTLAPTLFNLTAATPGSGGQGQEGGNVWLQHFLYQQARAQLVPSSPNTPAPLLPSATPTTFFLPRPAAEQAKVPSQTPSLAASLSHPAQPTMLFSAHMMLDGTLRPPGPPLALNTPTATISAPTPPSAASSISTLMTGLGAAGGEGKPVLTAGHSGLASLVAASTAASVGCGQSEPLSFPSSSIHMAVNMAAPGAGNSTVLSPTLTPRPTVASSLITMATGQHTQAPSSSIQPQATPTTTTPSITSTTSPRPSILRKRNLDGNSAVPRKPNFSVMGESHSPRPDTTPHSNISSPKTPATENSQSSTDTALSSNDATTPIHASHTDVRVKLEPPESGGPLVASPAVSTNSEASPRKRSRKQLFDVSRRSVSEEVKQNSSTDEEGDSKPPVSDLKQEHPLQHQEDYTDAEGVRWTRERTKPTMSIMSDYSVNWKPKHNHFQRQSDVRPKEEGNRTVNELISQRGILQKASGWRLYYVSTQLEEVIENEESLERRMEKLKERLSAMLARPCPRPPSYHYDYNTLLELTRGNLQRCQVVRQQMQEAKCSLLNLLRHEPKIRDIITKNLAKRTIKKKERS